MVNARVAKMTLNHSHIQLVHSSLPLKKLLLRPLDGCFPISLWPCEFLAGSDLTWDAVPPVDQRWWQLGSD